MAKHKSVSSSFLVALVAATAVTVIGAVGLANSLGESRVSEKCGPGPHATWLLVIQDGVVQPQSLAASRCDTLTIKNLDERGRLMAFGKHERHEPYNGVAERFLIQNESFTFTLNKSGTFRVHDHNQDSVQASFTVFNNN